MQNWLDTEVILQGQFVQLQPTENAHYPALQKIAEHQHIWQHLPADCSTPEKFATYYNDELLNFSKHNHYVFTVFDCATNTIVGSTRFFHISQYDKHLEIGWTWLDPAVWGTNINKEMKLLMLEFAFETLGAVRVQFRASESNDRSRAAILKIGAKYEGTIRKERLRDNGTFRNACYYSILDDEWPGVKENLQANLQMVQSK
jgi:RimJ/RimL family protein N-acetyltransferase